MSTQEFPDQALRQLFEKLPAGDMPPGLNRGIMEKIHRAEKIRQLRNNCLIWASVGISSAGMIVLGIGTFRYMGIDLTTTLKDYFQAIPNWGFYAFLGLIILLLLLLDYKLRQLFAHRSLHHQVHQ